MRFLSPVNYHFIFLWKLKKAMYVYNQNAINRTLVRYNELQASCRAKYHRISQSYLSGAITAAEIRAWWPNFVQPSRELYAAGICVKKQIMYLKEATVHYLPTFIQR